MANMGMVVITKQRGQSLMVANTKEKKSFVSKFLNGVEFVGNK